MKATHLQAVTGRTCETVPFNFETDRDYSKIRHAISNVSLTESWHETTELKSAAEAITAIILSDKRSSTRTNSHCLYLRQVTVFLRIITAQTSDYLSKKDLSFHRRANHLFRRSCYHYLVHGHSDNRLPTSQASDSEIGQFKRIVAQKLYNGRCHDNKHAAYGNTVIGDEQRKL